MLVQKTNWNVEADVVVVGYGCAGAIAAITAHDSGAQVVILEKQEDEEPISTSFMSGAVFIGPSDMQESKRYMEALYKVSDDLYWTEPDIINVWAQYVAENKKWLESIGAQISLRIHGGEHRVPGAESIDVYEVHDNGPQMMRHL